MLFCRLLGFVFLIGMTAVSAQDSSILSAMAKIPERERIVDVRQVIKDALDVMRAYPAPSTFTQFSPLSKAQQPTQPPPPQHYPRRAYGVSTYNGGVQSSVDRQYGDAADGHPDISVGRFFATPTKQDMERLFHLPADILSRLAADAGYIPPNEEGTFGTPNAPTNDGGADPSFHFNVGGSGAQSPTDLNSFIASLQGQRPVETVTQPAVVTVPGPPKITTRQVFRDGKLVSVPILIVPQASGENLYVPFADMRDLSDAVNKIISTGQFQLTTPKLPEPVDSDTATTTTAAPVHVEVEPPMKPVDGETKISESAAFVQQFDASTSATEKPATVEVTAETTTSATTTESTTTTTSAAATTRQSPRSRLMAAKSKAEANEITLNGHRYRLVALESAEVQEAPETEEVKTTEAVAITSTALPSTSMRPKILKAHRTAGTKRFLSMASKSTESGEDNTERTATRVVGSTEPRTYSLKELEELYNRENALASRRRGAVESEETEQHPIERIQRPTRNRQITMPKPKTGESLKETTEQQCQSVKVFARQFGLEDVETFARNNCGFIESHVPDLTCGEVVQFLSNCQKHKLL